MTEVRGKLKTSEQLMQKMCGLFDLSEAVVGDSYPSYCTQAPPPSRRAGHVISPSAFQKDKQTQYNQNIIKERVR